MKKFGKMRIAAAIALVAALLGSATASAVGGVTAESAAPTGNTAKEIKTASANTISYRMMAIGNDGTETPKTYNAVTEANLSDDSSDGDGKSLKLNNKDVFMPSFGMLPHGMNYRLSFKYKRKTNDSDDRLSIYLDNMNPSIVRAWYADPVSGGSSSEWTSYTYDFNSTSGQTDITYMRIASYGSYLIDELQINTLNEYVLNGSFEKPYYGKFTTGGTTLSAANMSSDSADGDGKALQLDLGNDYLLKYSMILPKNAKYKLSFKYKKLDESAKHITVKTDGYSVSEGNAQFWYAANADQGKVGEWVDYSFDFCSLGAGTSDIQYVMLTANGGDFLVDDVSVECVDDSFLDVQFLAGGNFGGAYLDGYEFYGTSNFNFAKQSDGTFAFASMHTTWGVGSGERGYFRIKTDMLETGKEYALSFDYYANGAGVEVAGVYNGKASSDKKPFVAINSPVTKWTNYEATFIAGQYNQNFLEVYGTAYGKNSTFIRNIQITDKTSGKTYIANQSLVSPEVKMIKNGASVRTSEPYGIRWAAGIRTADWNKLIEVYGENNVTAGVIVAPLDYVEQADEFTISAFNAASLKYADIVSDTFNAEVNAMAEGYSGFYASLVNIQAGNLNRKFAARAYVAVEKDGVVTYYYGEYSAENQARSIYEVSKSAVASSTEKEAVKEFAKGVLNKVIDVTVENGNAVLTEIAGYASPYAVSLSGNVLTITAADGADINNVKIVCVNGKNYKPTVSGNAVTVSID